jgi:hypothetical protein
MSDPKDERRASRRVIVRLPVTFKTKEGGAEHTAHTRDLSTQGIFFYVDREISAGTELEMVLILPGENRRVCYCASVVRVEASSGRNFGIAVALTSRRLPRNG